MDDGSNISFLAWIFAYAFFWCVIAAVITRLRKQGHTNSDSEAGYRSWPVSCNFKLTRDGNLD
jgi:hypothetical protein